MDSTWTHSEALHERIQEVVNKESDSQGIVTKFVVVAEVMDEDSKKLTCYRGPNEDSVPRWDVRGMFHELLILDDFFERDDDA